MIIIFEKGDVVTLKTNSGTPIRWEGKLVVLVKHRIGHFWKVECTQTGKRTNLHKKCFRIF